jgi:hypothetical protein
MTASMDIFFATLLILAYISDSVGLTAMSLRMAV